MKENPYQSPKGLLDKDQQPATLGLPLAGIVTGLLIGWTCLVVGIPVVLTVGSLLSADFAEWQRQGSASTISFAALLLNLPTAICWFIWSVWKRKVKRDKEILS